jgi:hypothetical protein
VKGGSVDVVYIATVRKLNVPEFIFFVTVV